MGKFEHWIKPQANVKFTTPSLMIFVLQLAIIYFKINDGVFVSPKQYLWCFINYVTFYKHCINIVHIHLYAQFYITHYSASTVVRAIIWGVNTEILSLTQSILALLSYLTKYLPPWHSVYNIITFNQVIYVLTCKVHLF